MCDPHLFGDWLQYTLYRSESRLRYRNLVLYELLRTFKQHSGVGALCNTSLNFKGRGFINSLSELSLFAEQHNLDGFIVGDTLFQRQG